MNMNWHKIVLACPHCEREPTILSISAAADGDIMLDLVCVSCGKNLVWKSNFTRLIQNSMLADQEEDSKRPPPPDVDGEAFDQAFLHELHICLPDQRLLPPGGVQ